MPFWIAFLIGWPCAALLCGIGMGKFIKTGMGSEPTSGEIQVVNDVWDAAHQ